jgi:FkbH-like protein
MFQVEWARDDIWRSELNSFPSHTSLLEREAVSRASLLHWEDHCLECAAPLCYSTCPLYSPRPDVRCARLAYGIYPNPCFIGLFDYGADVRFRRWGKIEAIMYGKTASIKLARGMDFINRALACPSGPVFGRIPGTLGVLWRNNVAKCRNKLFSWFAPTPHDVFYDDFVLECFSPDPETFRLVLEYSVGTMTADHTFVGELKFRHSFNIVSGWNFYELPAKQFGVGSRNRVSKITIYPENNAERRLIFTWLDLVQYKNRRERGVDEGVPPRLIPAPKVKCVAWDLDNTLWKGILAEDSDSHLVPRPEAMRLIRSLDEKGIIQTLVSKNNHNDAWPIVERLGLGDYFLYPAINWSPKSLNLREIAGRLNIDVDTFALIDDSAFERAEVEATLPQVRVYSDDQISQLLSYPEFNVPITASGKARRMCYLTEIQRESARSRCADNYEEFLRSCEMTLRLFTPRQEKHIARCLELIQRSNQLNLSNIRYTAEEFRELLSCIGTLCVAMDCCDRFGQYGLVGFASIEESHEQPTLRDLVISCRVAQKRVEHAFIHWLAQRQLGMGKRSLRARLVKTERNGPIRQVFDDLNFRPIEQSGASLLEVSLDAIVLRDVVTVQTDL